MPKGWNSQKFQAVYPPLNRLKTQNTVNLTGSPLQTAATPNVWGSQTSCELRGPVRTDVVRCRGRWAFLFKIRALCREPPFRVNRYFFPSSILRSVSAGSREFS